MTNDTSHLADYGETTDEDDVPASATARPQALVRRPSPCSTKTLSSGTPTPVHKASNQRRGPRMGSWCVDPTKPVAIVDSCGKRLLICPARRPTKPDRVFEHFTGSGTTTANTSPRPSTSQLAVLSNDSDNDHSDISSQGVVSPMFGPPNPLDSVLLENNFLATSAVYPEYMNANMALYENVEYDDDDDDYENGITLDDLIKFDGEEEVEDSRPLSSASDSNNLATASQNSCNLLDHLDGGVVTAFRQNQQETLQPRSSLRKRKASSPLGAVTTSTRRRIMA